MRLSLEERSRIDQCVAAFEAHTGAQVVTAVVAKSDNYPEIPWKAFALGAAATALVRLLVDLARPDWLTGYQTLVDAFLILGVGAAMALATIRVHSFARLFLQGARAEAEVMQHAHVLFMRHEISATPSRNGVLILVSYFERRVAILPDSGLQARVGDAELQPIIGRMTPLLAQDKVCEALCNGVAEVEALLVARGFHPAGNEGAGLPDAVIEERGDDARR